MRTPGGSATTDPFLAVTGDAAAAAAREPYWQLPNDLDMIVGSQFEREHGVDRAVATMLVRRGGTFDDIYSYLFPRKRMVRSPERTVPGMNAAGRMVADAIEAGEKIAAFADYDPDGTTALEAFRLGIAPYMSDPCPGCGGRKGADCFRCGGQGKLFRSDRFHVGYADAQRGFGLTDDFVREAHAAGASILITLDCGSTQTRQVALAKSLGMKVIVVDHHNVDPDNPADHHLNPHLHGPENKVSQNTGAQLAWKLGAAVQIAISGRTREEHWGRAMFLAGFGCRADMGSTIDPEHRAFFRIPIDGEKERDELIPPGLALLSERMGEDPRTPAGGVLTSAAMNLAKRTPLVSAADVGALLACESKAQAEPLVDRLCAAYDRARPWRRRMLDEAISQAETSPDKDRVAKVILDGEEGFRDYAGYSGSVANDTARRCGKPVICFAPKGVDEQGREVFKFSMRSGRVKQQIGELITSPEMRAACQLEQRDESGELVTSASLGGHADVVSGSCYADKIDEVFSTAEAWAQSFNPYRWFPEKWSGADAYLLERKIPAARFLKLEEQAKRLAPFAPKDRNRKPSVSVVGRVSDLAPDPDSPQYSKGVIEIGNGIRRPVMIHTDRVAELPSAGAEFVLELGEDRPFFLRNWHAPEPTAEAAAA